MKILRNILIGIVVLVIVLLIAVQVIVNMSFVKEKIVTVVEDQVSRKVELGSLRVGFLTGLSLQINDFYLHEKDSEEIFLGLEALKVKVKLLPLLGKKVEVAGIEIIKPQITIIKHIDGLFNFSSLMESKPSEKPAEEVSKEVVEEKVSDDSAKAGELPQVNISYIKIKDASLVYKMETEKGKFEDFSVKGLNVLLDKFSLHKPFDVLISSEIGKKANIELKTKVGAISDLIAAPETTPLKATFSLQNFSSNELSALLPKETLSLIAFSNMNISSDIDGSLKDGLKLNLTIKTDPLDKSNAVSVDSSVKLSIQASLEDIMNSKFNADINLKELKIKNDLFSDIISVSGALLVVPDTITLKDLALKTGSSNINTSATIKNYKNFPETTIDFAVISDFLDINALIPQVAPSDKKQTAEKKEVEKTEEKIEKTASQSAPQNNDMLKKLALEGKIDFKKIVYQKNTITNFVVNLSVKNGIASLDKLSLAIFEGAIDGSAKMSLIETPAPFETALSIKDLNVKEALIANADYNKFSGTLASKLTLKGTGYSLDDLKKALTGNADITLTDGVLAGKSLKQDILEKMDNPLLNQLLPGLAKERKKTKEEKKEETKIQDLIVSLIIGNGIITLDKLSCGTEDLTLRGNGTVNFDLQANLKAQAILTKEFTEALTAGKDMSGTLPYEEGGIVIPVTVTGLITNPTVLPDLAMILKAASKGALKDKLGSLLGGGKDKDEAGEEGKKDSPLGGLLGGDKESGKEGESKEDKLKKLLPLGGEEKDTGSDSKKENKLPIKLPFGGGSDDSSDGKKKGGFKLF